jgi:TatD DNase family protein
MLIDSHCHLYLAGPQESIPVLLERALEQGVERVLCVGIDLESSRTCLELADNHPEVFASAGIHPHEADSVPDDYLQQLEELLQHPKVVAVGEMGLDFYRNLSSPAIQTRVFREQLALARTVKKPVIFHNRNADQEVIRILTEEGWNHGVAHCFSSDLVTARTFLQLGFTISFAGNLTFKNSPLPAVAKEIPLDRILVETDSPYLSPVPFRGKPNEPARVRLVAEKLAEIRGCPLAEIAHATRSNTEALFRLPGN